MFLGGKGRSYLEVNYKLKRVVPCFLVLATIGLVSGRKVAVLLFGLSVSRVFGLGKAKIHPGGLAVQPRSSSSREPASGTARICPVSVMRTDLADLFAC
jgi:hypothetical protein